MINLMSVRARLLTLSLALILILLAAGLSLRSIVVEDAALQAAAQVHELRAERLQAVQRSVTRLRDWARRFANLPAQSALPDNAALAEFELSRQALEEALLDLEATDAAVHDRLHGAAEKMMLRARDLDQASRNGQRADILPLVAGLREGLADADAILMEASLQAQTLAQARAQESRSRAQQSLRLSTLILLAALAAAVLVTMLLLRSVLSPLAAITRATRQVNSGVRPSELPTVSSDEFGVMALALHQFRDHAERLDRLAYTDPLTGLPNRVRMEESLRERLADCEQKRIAAALLFMDLDHFRSINDTLGHSFGDRYLAEAARRLRELVPPNSQLFRYSGDQFALLMAGMTANDMLQARVQEVAQRILDAMAVPSLVENHRLSMALSIGAALFPRDGAHAEDLVSNADAAMHEAKTAGRNNVQFASRELTDSLRRQLHVASDIRRGLEAGEFEPFFQPVLDISAGVVVGVEALVRWRHVSRGLVMPGEFIGVAEQSGIIGKLGEAVLRRGCEAITRLGREPLRLSVNLSARQLRESDLPRAVAELLIATGLPAQRLEFEITESAIMENVERNVRTLQALRDLGVGLSIDDFGTGYSSLSYVQRFPVTKIKIDRSFVSRLCQAPEAAAIVKATIAIARSLNLDVVAEGVETEEQSRRLRELGCPLQQGFLFTPALPLDQLRAWLQPPPRLAA